MEYVRSGALMDRTGLVTHAAKLGLCPLELSSIWLPVQVVVRGPFIPDTRFRDRHLP
jgi:hypothetical protein